MDKAQEFPQWLASAEYIHARIQNIRRFEKCLALYDIHNLFLERSPDLIEFHT
jgi:hypothetical protein